MLGTSKADVLRIGEFFSFYFLQFVLLKYLRYFKKHFDFVDEIRAKFLGDFFSVSGCNKSIRLVFSWPN